MTQEQFKSLRTALALSQEQIASLFGIDRRTITRYETGAATIPKIVELALRSLVAMKQTAAPEPPDWRVIARQKYAGRETLNAAEAAEYLGVHPRTVLDWVNAGLIPKPQIVNVYRGRLHMHLKSDLDQFLVEDRMRVGRRSLRPITLGMD